MTIEEIIKKSGISLEVLRIISRDYVEEKSSQDKIEDYLMGAFAYAENMTQLFKKERIKLYHSNNKKKLYKEKLEDSKKDKINAIRQKCHLTDKGELTAKTNEVLETEIDLFADRILNNLY